MPKIDLQDVESLTNEQSALSRLASNNAIIEQKSDTFLSRDGSSPNQMQASLDMNSNRIINLPAPVTDTEPVRKLDLGDAPGYAAAASASAAEALNSSVSAASSAGLAFTSETNASTSADESAASALEAANQVTLAAAQVTLATTQATNAAGSATTAANNATVIAGSKYSFESSTTMASPATGGFRFNNATVGSVTAIALNAQTNDAGNPNQRSYILTWDDSTSSPIKGHVIFRKLGTPSTFAVFAITALTDNTSWIQLTVTHINSNGTWTAGDQASTQYYRAGDAGSSSGDVIGPAASVDSELTLFSGTTGKLLKRATNTGILKTSSGVLSTATSGTDYAPATSGTSILKGNGSGGFSSATASTDYAPATSGTAILKGNGSGGFSATTAGTDYLSPSVSSNLTVGYTNTSYSIGTISSGTLTLNPANGHIQHYTNSGAHTLSPPANPCTIIVEVTNSSAGAITMSGFSIVNGDTYSSTGTKKHIFTVTKTQNFSKINVEYVTGT